VQTATLSPAPVADMAKFEQQLDQLARMQAKVDDVLGSQQKGVVQLQQAMVKLSSTQESFESNVLTVREEIEKRLETVGRETDRQTRQMASRGRVEQEQLEAAIHNLTADNHRLSKEVVSLAEYNQVLKSKLQTAVASASKAVDPSPERLLKMADSLQATQQMPFLFWVTFSDGTSQESIDKWVYEMQGHKGTVSEGWQEVRIVPPAVPPDRFLEQIRGEKIVKAARIGQ
jgi:septal ring factor EnvC (AmiA/AmiB activator)